MVGTLLCQGHLLLSCESVQVSLWAWPSIQRKERHRTEQGLFLKMPGVGVGWRGPVVLCREGHWEGGATFGFKQHFQENGLKSASCSVQAAWARPWSY